jgi:hypothetical protein
VKHSVSNGKRPVSNVNKRAKMFAVCAWMQIAVQFYLTRYLLIWINWILKEDTGFLENENILLFFENLKVTIQKYVFLTTFMNDVI